MVEDTLGGALEAKHAWTRCGMTEDVSTGVDAVPVPAIIAIGDRDQVERAAALREVFAHCLPHATFRVLEGIGHSRHWRRRTRLSTSAPACLTPLSKQARSTFLRAATAAQAVSAAVR